MFLTPGIHHTHARHSCQERYSLFRHVVVSAAALSAASCICLVRMSHPCKTIQSRVCSGSTWPASMLTNAVDSVSVCHSGSAAATRLHVALIVVVSKLPLRSWVPRSGLLHSAAIQFMTSNFVKQRPGYRHSCRPSSCRAGDVCCSCDRRPANDVLCLI